MKGTARSSRTPGCRRELRLATHLFATLCVVLTAGCSSDRKAATLEEPGATPSAHHLATAVPNPVAGSHAVHASAPFDLSAVMRQVHFAFRMEEGSFRGGDGPFRAQVDDRGGIAVVPRHVRENPKSKPGPRAATPRVPASVERGAVVEGAATRFEAVGISHGDRSILKAAAAPRASEDGGLDVARGAVVEHVRNTEEGLEQSWSLAKRPEGSGDLVVRVAVSGTRYAGESSQGLHFVDDATGLGLRYGWATWVDGRGARTDVRGYWEDGQIIMRVPSSVLARSTWPAVLDPVISAEFGIDHPAAVPSAYVAHDARVAFGSGQYLVAWTDDRGGYSSLVGARVKSDGTVLDRGGILLVSGTSDSYIGAPGVASDGTDFLVVFDTQAGTSMDIHGIRVKADGTLPGSPFVVSNAAEHQVAPQVAFGGTSYLVVWSDFRAAGAGNVYGSRVSTAGITLDPAGVPISALPTGSVRPFLDFDGSNYLVAWHDQRGGNPAVYASRVNTSGVPQDAGFQVATGAFVDPVGVAFDGTTHLIVWRRGIDSNGVWSEGLACARVTKQGTVVDSPAVTIRTDQKDTNIGGGSATFDGSDFLVAWWEHKLDSDALLAARVKPDATLLDPTPLALATGLSSPPAVASDGAQSLVVTASEKKVAGYRLNQDGSLADAFPANILGLTNSQDSPAAVFDGTNYLVVWPDTRLTSNSSPNSRIMVAARVAPSGTLLDPAGILLTNTPARRDMNPAVAFDPAGFLVAWESSSNAVVTDCAQKNAACKILASRISSSGVLLDATPKQVSPSTGVYHGARNASVAFGAGEYVVVWEGCNAAGSSDPGACNPGSAMDVFATRIKPDGSILDSSGIPVSTTPQEEANPAIAFDGTRFMIVWQQRSTGADTTLNIRGARLTPAGALVDTNGFSISSGANDQTSPALAFGSNYFVAWADARGGSRRIYGSRLIPEALALDPNGLKISDAAGDQTAPATTWDGARFLVVWNDVRAGNDDIYTARVTTSGSVLDPLGQAIASDTSSETLPAIASEGGGRALIAYRRHVADVGDSHTRIRGRFVTLGDGVGSACSSGEDCQSTYCVDGVCCESECFGSCQACSAAAKTSGADGTCGPAKEGTDPRDSCKDDGGPSCGKNGLCDGKGACQSYSVSPGCTPRPCTSGSECTSGACVDGICCDSWCGGMCSSCLASKKGQGVDGQCGPVLAGTDPDGECTADPGFPNSCKTDGHCNGNGQCRVFAPSGTACGDTMCSAGQVTGFQCNGAGTCISGTSPCAPYTCNGTVCNSSCTGQAQCSSGSFCKNGTCIALLSNGSPCDAGSECASKLCVEGVCCDSLCDGACQSCLAANKVSGATGLCGAMKANIDPKDGCPADTSNACGADGMCDGSGACRVKAPLGLSCGAGSICQGNSVVGNACNGQGVCQSGSAVACEPFACKGGSCLSSCSSPSDCLAGYTCVAGTCITKNVDGLPCNTGTDCLSGFCAGGVCCDSVCDGNCESCKGPEKATGGSGTCGPVKANTDPKNVCEADGTQCGPNGMCNGLGSCATAAPVNAPCGPSTCLGEQLAAQLCDGQGKCTSVPSDCPSGYKCSAGVCPATCANDNDCAADYRCSGDSCVPRKAVGKACTDANECISGFCVDSVCCDSPCTGQCEACDQSGKLGLCAPVTGVPHGTRQKCATQEADCKGACDGADTTECKYPGSSTFCASTACDGNVFKPVVCDGHGACKALGSQSCDNYACDLESKACKTKCTSDSDCSTGSKCNGSSGICAVPVGVCKGDQLQNPDGTLTSCGAYRCKNGQCPAACTFTSDCSAGYECDDSGACRKASATDAGQDAPDEAGVPAQAGEETGGCGCRTVSRSRRPETLIALLFGMAALRLRRDRGSKAARRPSHLHGGRS